MGRGVEQRVQGLGMVGTGGGVQIINGRWLGGCTRWWIEYRALVSIGLMLLMHLLIDCGMKG